MRRATQGHLPHWPGSVVGQDGGQQADSHGVLSGNGRIEVFRHKNTGK